MDDAMRKQIEPIFNSLNPEYYGLMTFPPKDDDGGGGDGSDQDLASIIFYGSLDEPDESVIEFAIKLGRELEKNGIS